MSKQEFEQPSLTPGPNEFPVENRDYDTRCQQQIWLISAGLDWKIGDPIIFQSDEWGLVWRADFTAGDYESTGLLINRLVFWEGDDDVIHTTAAFGQRIEPLRET